MRAVSILSLDSVWPSTTYLTPRSPATNAENRFRICESPMRRIDETTGPVAGSCSISGNPAASAYKEGRRVERTRDDPCVVWKRQLMRATRRPCGLTLVG